MLEVLARPIRVVRSRPGLFVGAVASSVLGLALPSAWGTPTRVLVAWDVGVLAYLLVAYSMMARSDAATMRRRAIEQDVGAFVILVLTVLACFASVGAIVVELAADDAPRGVQLALVAATIVLSWTLVHTMFALHYAHEYELGCEDRPEIPGRVAGGLDFQSDEPPDYADFVYFAFVIGVAAQTADVVITSKRLRRYAAAHGIVSFYFNTTVLALAMNLVAGLF
ncbi:DUF1345 domain-containing protein [Sandaracinus amylolyticus]|uniref:Putative transmembrane protein n=1 Tax=Sandaracinus amylolyticus TaxID=927083 RepID=A0A0F6YKH9_9BACT|nr:DUF1345 domain-containing protein [Sandaracinus amylolyticus]AKF09172.1 Putative transmembrane protein [Sandaracinus amylolyticus]